MKVSRKNEPINDKNEWKSKVLGDGEYSRLVMNRNKNLIKDYNQKSAMRLNTRLDTLKIGEVDSYDQSSDMEGQKGRGMEKTRSK